MYYVSRIFAVIALCVLAIAAYFSIRLAVADSQFRRQTSVSVARALEILPGNTGYLALRALQLDYGNQDQTPLVERARRLNPLAFAPRIRLRLAAETLGDTEAAEKWLLDAARVDRQFEPRWTLANFYFRQDRAEVFWKWMRAALEVSYADRRLAFDLCWRVGKNPDEILSRAIPHTTDVVTAYLYYVMDRHREETGPVALQLAAMQTPADTQALEAASDLLIEAGKASAAGELWRQLGHASSGLLSNGDFLEEPCNRGFDWRLIQQPGVTHVQLTPAAGHRIGLSGKQPESCDLMF